MDSNQKPVTPDPKLAAGATSEQPMSATSSTGAVINPSTPPGAAPAVVQAASSSKVMFMVIAVVIIAILGGGAYWYYSQINSVPKSVVPTETSQQQTPAKTDEDKTITELELEINGLVSSDPSGDFTAIDQDLQSL